MAEMQLPAGVSADEIVVIARRFGARNVRVFGSRARGQARDDSDLDLIVDLESGRDLIDLAALKQALEERIKARVDVLTEPALSPYLRDEILRGAVAL